MTAIQSRIFAALALVFVLYGLSASTAHAAAFPIETSVVSSPDQECIAVAEATSSGDELAQKRESCTRRGVFVEVGSIANDHSAEIRAAFDSGDGKWDGDDGCNSGFVSAEDLERDNTFSCGIRFEDGTQLQYRLTVTGDDDAGYVGEVTRVRDRSGGKAIESFRAANASPTTPPWLAIGLGIASVAAIGFWVVKTGVLRPS